MRFNLYLFLTVFILSFCCTAFSQSGKPSIAAEPSWVTKNNIDYNITSLDKSAEDGYIDINVESQVSIPEKSRYYRYSKKIISQAGVQNASEISVAFDPSYEQLIFHSIKIIRNGETLNKLQLSSIKTIHEETALKNFIYNGLLDAVLILDDVRKGDIIEYSYTTKGFNPIYKNKFAGGADLQFSVPVYQVYYKVIVPQGRKINIKTLHETLEPVTSTINGQQVYEWRKNNIPPLPLQDYTPSWYSPYGEVRVSEYNSWKELNDWAMELFPVKKQLAAPVIKKIKEIEAANPTDSGRTKAALRFVQDEIRYMGIEMGKNSHLPADPSKVFNQRFGDCKEKSYLLCCMLRAMNIEASPVLINTVTKKNISAYLPAPGDFDHATVRVKLDNAFYWFDPTIAYQRGSIKDLFYPDYQAGLVITDTTTALTTIVSKNTSSVSVKEYFKVTDMYGGGTLMVVTNFRGSQADDVRNDFNNESIAELLKNYQKFYAGSYADIQGDSLTYVDNDSSGVFTTTEYYTIPAFWKTEKSELKKFSFGAFSIDELIRRPKEKDRKMPFSIMFPAKYEEKVVVELPDYWHVTENEMDLKNASFAYHAKFYCINNHVYLDASYEAFKDHANIDEAPAYFKDLDEYTENNNYELTSGTDTSSTTENKNSPKKSNTSIIGIFFVVGIIIAAIVWWSRQQ